MKRASTLLAAFAVTAASAAPALAEWRWVDDAPATTRTETRIYEERLAPQPAPPPVTYDRQTTTYYSQQPRTVVRETYTPVVETGREIYQDGPCDVTRSYMSDGSTHDERVCTRLLTPHEFLIDRIGRHFDRLRGYSHNEF